MRSREFMKEKEEKKKLEKKIKMMSSQVLKGVLKSKTHHNLGLLQNKNNKKLDKNMKKRLADLENERQYEEDKAQVDRYKQLLLKQKI